MFQFRLIIRIKTDGNAIFRADLNLFGISLTELTEIDDV